MSALGISVYTYAFPDPATTPISERDFHQVNSSLAFSFDEVDRIRTLSTTDTRAGADLSGLLYAPTISDPGCNATQYVPYNATQVSLPHQYIFYIAIAPWISPACTLSYLNEVQDDPIRAFLFFLPNNGTTAPPLANDPVWSLGDGGKWKSKYRFPVYAIPNDSASILLNNLALYSGNLTDVPNGHLLGEIYPPGDYVRLTVGLDIAGGTTLPSLWVFLLIVLAILILIIGSTSFIMHYVQRKRRDRLRRRVSNGEVDLEALGIKRLTVPKDVLDKMPTYTYAASPNNRSSTAESDILTGKETSSIAEFYQPPPTADSDRSYAQPTCAICLDDYTAGESQVRELPCRHIFHPECIDVFLSENSSLCPMCKKTVLPRGYCPAVITNAMVRRERMIRRLRDRTPESGDATHYSGVRGTFARIGANGRRVFAPPRQTTDSANAPSATEMRDAASFSDPTAAPAAATAAAATAATDSTIPAPPQPEAQPTGRPSSQHRREWARQRALAMLGRGRNNSLEQVVDEEERRRPVWRKAVGRVWPGVA